VDLKRSRSLVVSSILAITAASHLFAAAQLRLEKTAIGPISVSVGSNGPTQVVNASNAGDQPLSLRASASVPWLNAVVQPLQSCGTLGNCLPINIALNTASLAKGSYTGIVTITDPNAIDAPQTITVTVLVGGGVPDNLTFYVPANGTPVTSTFNTARAVSTVVNQPSAVSVSVAAPGGGSFATVWSYTVVAKANTGAAPGTYNGSLTVAGSSVAAENKTVPLTLNVTSQPIASPSALNQFRIAAGAAKQTQYIALSNLGAGTITVSNAAAATASGGNWLAASIVNGFVAVTADPAGVAQGNYQGTVTIASNAANGTIAVPVQLEVISSGPPVVHAGGVVNNANFEPSGQLAQGDLPAIFGEQLTAGDVAQAASLPLTTSLGGATVFVNNQPAPLYYVSANQINFEIPYEAQPGPGTLRVDRDGQRGNTVSIVIAKSSPKLLIAVDQQVNVVSTPFGGAATPVKAGETITIYGLGFGQTTPPAQTGAASPSSPLAVVPGTNEVFFGNGGLFQNPISQKPDFVGLTPGSVALYQVNVTIPANAPKGASVPVFVQGDAGTSNVLNFNIQ
jgi:uncharacterized protein (TIGR03437 family)